MKRWALLLGALVGCASAASSPPSPSPAPSSSPSSSSSSPAPSSSPSSSSSSSSPSSSSPALSSAVVPLLSPGELPALRARLDAIVSGVRSGSHGLLVQDVASGQVLYERGPDELLIPASNEKLFTTAAALGLQGAEYRMVTAVLGSAEPVDGEVDEVTLVGVYDPSWSRHWGEPGARLGQLAASLRERGVRKVRGVAWVVGGALWDAERGKELDLGAHRQAVASRWRLALERAGIRVGRVQAREALPASKGVELATVASEPLSRVVEPINQLSHNGFADALLMHLGQAREGDAARGPAAVKGWLASVGVDATGLTFVDGSGLSRGNRVTARSIVGLMAAAQGAAWGPVFRSSLAVAGEKGTLAGRLKGTPGKILGKTGSLSQVVATSGRVEREGDGRVVLFAMLANGVTDAAAVRRMHDQLIAAVAGIGR